MRYLKFLLTIGLLSGLVLAVDTIAAQAEHSTNAYANNTDWNLCGARCHAGNLQPAHALADSALLSGRQRPLTITVQEICSGQFGTLRTRLGSDYMADAYVAKTNVTSASDCSWFGNAVFWRGGAHPDGNYWKTFAAQTGDDSGRGELRGYICAKAAFPLYSSCSVHVTDDGEIQSGKTVKEHQLEEFTAWGLWSNSCCAPTFLAGDLNMTPTTVKAYDSRLYENFWEADEPGTTSSRSTLDSYNLKYDYSFGPRSTHRVVHDAYIFESRDWSDHRVLVAYQGSR
jgi:endonuclease/exonuclease/phosphatase family metal-dependent hydrolase